MAFVPPKDRVLEYSASNSQSVFDVTGAPDASFNPFSSAMSVGDTTFGGVVEPGVAFKSGILTYSNTGEVTVSTVFASKGTFSSSGTKQVFMGMPAKATRGPVFAFEGDSLTNTAVNGTWPLILAANFGFFSRGNSSSYYFAASGETAASMVSEYATQAGALLLGQEAYYFLWAGTNDVAAGTTAATIYGYLTTMWAAARASGYKVCAFTIMRRGDISSGQNDVRIALNALIRSDSTLYDFLVEPDLYFPNPSEASVFQSDTIHLTTTTGNQRLAQKVAGVILGTQPVYAAPLDALSYNGLQINGGMEVDQQHAGAAVTGITAAFSYVIDGVLVQSLGTSVLTAQQVSDAPPGLNNSVKITVTTAEATLSPGSGDGAFVRIPIEGYRTSRLAYGTLNAQPMTIGFWVKAHRIGTYGGGIRNSAGNRSYPFLFSINVADTWEFKAVTITGDVTGTWVGNTNGVGLYLFIAMAAEATIQNTPGAWYAGVYLGPTGQTNGVAATTDVFQITGVCILPGIHTLRAEQLSRILRPFDQELLLAQRLYWKTFLYATAPAQNAGLNTGEYAFVAPTAAATTQRSPRILFPQRMRASPTITLFNPSATNAQIRDTTASADCSSSASSADESGVKLSATGNASTAVGNLLETHIVADARL